MNLTDYETLPRSQRIYMMHFGPHFNKALCHFAVSNMFLDDEELQPIEPFTKEHIDEILASNNIRLANNRLYDYIFVANMAKADYMGEGGCLENEQQLARYIKNVIDDPDAKEGVTFARWLATMAVNGIEIEWSDILDRS